MSGRGGGNKGVVKMTHKRAGKRFGGITPSNKFTQKFKNYTILNFKNYKKRSLPKTEGAYRHTV